ncbi:hypothetical protein ACLM5H_02365 [Fredinandcohnia humi]
MESPIEKLLNWIFSNIWILIIVGGFVLNTIRRFKTGESAPTTQIPLPKQYNPFDQEKKETHAEYDQTKYETVEEPRDVLNSEPKKSFYEKYLELQQNNTYGSDPSFEEEVDLPPVSKPIPINKPVPTKEQPTSRSFSKNKVVEGIIWSEILGPPRAKRPFQRRY